MRRDRIALLVMYVAALMSGLSIIGGTWTTTKQSSGASQFVALRYTQPPHNEPLTQSVAFDLMNELWSPALKAPSSPTAPPPAATTTTVTSPPAPPTPTSFTVTGWDPNDSTGITYAEFVEWSRVAVCEEGGWGHYVYGPSYYGSIGISAAAWSEYSGTISRWSATPDEQIEVGIRITGGWVPDQGGCASW